MQTYNCMITDSFHLFDNPAIGLNVNGYSFHCGNLDSLKIFSELDL